MEVWLSLFKLGAACVIAPSGLPSLYDHISCTVDPATGTLSPDISSLQDLLLLVGNVTRIVIALGGAVALISVVVAAIYFVTSNGDPARIKRAKEILTNLTIGLGLIIGAYAIVTFIAGGF